MSKNKNKKSNKRKRNNNKADAYDVILNNPIATLVVSALAVLFGIFFMLSQGDNKPIERDEAISYSGVFDEYETWRNYRGINFKDGSSYQVYPHTETSEFYDTMTSLEKGTVLHLLINPNNDYVAEIRTDTEELLNFEESQRAIDSYDNGYIGIGIFACAAGAFLACYAIGSYCFQKKESKRQIQKDKKRIKGQSDPAMRIASDSVKHKILLDASVGKYKICYRRVKHTNELVVNGIVYDEIKGIVEFEHNLNAIIDNHKIEAGIDKNSYSYIIYDGRKIAEKKRLI